MASWGHKDDFLTGDVLLAKQAEVEVPAHTITIPIPSLSSFLGPNLESSEAGLPGLADFLLSHQVLSAAEGEGSRRPSPTGSGKGRCLSKEERRIRRLK